MKSAKNGGVSPLVVMLVFSLGYFVSYVFRGVNLAAAPSLSTELGLTPADLGALTSLYFGAFAASQLPLGLLLDRFGPRRVVAALLAVAAAGSVLFASAHGTAELAAGRILIGVGVSGCLMGALKAVAMWHHASRLAAVNGFVFAIGGLGSVATGAPAEWLLRATDWRGLFLLLAALTLATAGLILAAVPERRGATAPAPEALAAQLRGLGVILRSASFRRVAPILALSQGTFMSVQGLWAAPFMRDVAGLDAATVGDLVSLIGVAMVAGYALSGAAAKALAAWSVPITATAGAGILAFASVQAAILGGIPLPHWLAWTLYGFAGSTGVLYYAVLASAFPQAMIGRVNTALNLAVFAASFAIQAAIGAIVASWPAGAVSGSGHCAAWAILLALQLAAFAWYCLARRPRLQHAPGAALARVPR